jgi:signal transduction histidine kinase
VRGGGVGSPSRTRFRPIPTSEHHAAGGRTLPTVSRSHARQLFVENRLEVAWVGFACLNLVAMLVLITDDGPHGWETVPFHLIYVSFTLLYGYRMWRSKGTIAGITFVSLSAGGMTLLAVHRSREDWAELTEVPLMGLMFLAMVYHVRRRQDAVAESNRLASNLRASLQRQRDFVSNASHELLTPITIARGHIDLVRHYHAADNDEVAGACDTVVGELERMERLIDQLLLIEGAPTPGFLLPVEVDLPEFMRVLYQRWHVAAPRRWVLGAVTTAVVTIDRDRVVIALDELLENAVRHTQDQDRIEITAVVRGGTVAFSVADPGSGIPPAAQARVFDRFYRVDGDRNRRSGGAGLGLSLVRAVAEAHGGHVSVRANRGGGSVFTIALPVSSAGAQPIPASADGLDAHAGVQLAT